MSYPLPLPSADSGSSVLDRDTIGAYSGLYSFHKYWGKKPAEVFQYLIRSLSEPGELILDPFVGSGVLAREAKNSGRHFIGIDINPAAVHMCRLLVDPPTSAAVKRAFVELTRNVKQDIMSAYMLAGAAGFATHYLWNEQAIQSVWTKRSGRSRTELDPVPHDYDLFNSYDGYASKNMRPIRLFDNSRINTKKTLAISDLLTGRAQRNIDLILDAIDADRTDVKDALLSCVTSAIGQMSKMVFAITGRGKTTGTPTSRIEVGSWVIGYWRPKLHFEINAWNCFERRVTKLIKALEAQEDALDLKALADRHSVDPTSRIELGDARTVLRQYKENSASLIITDPPHGDRIPYLELSELWNAVLNCNSAFRDEIVISNAKERDKGMREYQEGITEVFDECNRILKPGGCMVVLFNARDADSWAPLKPSLDKARIEGLTYSGAFEAHYSVGSVVQDNRDGGLQHDFGLVFTKCGDGTGSTQARAAALAALPGWTADWPC